MRALLPVEVLGDYEEWLTANGFPRMDHRGAMGSGTEGDSWGRGEYYIKRGDDTITFRDVTLAPPAGVMASNYAR